MAGRGFGAGSAPAHAWVSWLSWDLSGSSQPLNFNLSKIFGVPRAIPLPGVGGIAPGTAGFLHDVEALSILAPILHPGPHPASSPCKDVEDDPNSGRRRGTPSSITRSPEPQAPLQVPLWRFRALQPRRGPFPPAPLRQPVAPRGFEGAVGPFLPAVPRAGGLPGREDGWRRSSACQDASACVFLVAAEGCLCCLGDDTMLLA